MACVKLHSLLQTVLCLSWEEVCFLLGHLGAPLWPAGSKDCGDDNRSSETFSQLVPIVRTLLDQHADPVNLQSLLPSLPPTNGSPSFAQDLQAFCHTVEWQSFYQHQVQRGPGGPHLWGSSPGPYHCSTWVTCSGLPAEAVFSTDGLNASVSMERSMKRLSSNRMSYTCTCGDFRK